MRRAIGRHVFVVDLRATMGDDSLDAFAAKCARARFNSVWVRVGRGAALDRNFSIPGAADIAKAFRAAGVELWGWHVPFCARAAAARTESDNVWNWAFEFGLDGIVVDAEATPENPRFQGGAAQARAYMQPLSAALASAGKGLALSSHDQPPLHSDLPFDEFSRWVFDVCPQVYHRGHDVETRLARSIAGFAPLETGRDFADRYKPTGNISTRGDVRVGDAKECLAAAGQFIGLAKANGFAGYGFWCLDDAPGAIWDFLAKTPV